MVQIAHAREPCASGRELLAQARQAELAEAGGRKGRSGGERRGGGIRQLVVEDRGDDDSNE